MDSNHPFTILVNYKNDNIATSVNKIIQYLYKKGYLYCCFDHGQSNHSTVIYKKRIESQNIHNFTPIITIKNQIFNSIYNFTGRGTLCLKDDCTYESDFINGHMIGTATYRQLSNGLVYTGEIRNSHLTGECTIIKPPSKLNEDHYVYSGRVLDMTFHGYGKLKTAYRLESQGHFTLGEISGNVMYTNFDGVIEYGTIINGHFIPHKYI